MEDSSSPSLLAKLSGFLFFFSITVASFFWFIASASTLFQSIYDRFPVVNFDKGSMYALGAGLTSLVITLVGSYQGITRTELSKKQEVWARNAMIFGVVVMFVFPHAVHFSVNKIVEQRNYFDCEKMSYRWLLYKKIVYVNKVEICEDLVRQKEITKSSYN